MPRERVVDPPGAPALRSPHVMLSVLGGKLVCIIELLLDRCYQVRPRFLGTGVAEVDVRFNLLAAFYASRPVASYGPFRGKGFRNNQFPNVWLLAVCLDFK